MGKAYFLEAATRQEGKTRLGLEQHFLDISILGVIAQAEFYGKELSKDWNSIKEHVFQCEQCQYDVSNLKAALETEEEARREFLGLTDQ